MDSLYEMPIARPPGRPPVIDDPRHILTRGEAKGLRRAGWRREKIAEALNVHRSTLWRWERLDEWAASIARR